jgi:hypothetical protein
MSFRISTLITAALLGLILNAGTIMQVHVDSPLFGAKDASITVSS